ncbi:MAG: nitrogen fixation protein [Proteobacteria bacterium]|nr:MAG: nitrogen fixation protein [Pseudomonadota bacterium]
MKIGVSSQNFRTITGHAGKSRRFIIFSATTDKEAQETERLDLPMEMSIHAWDGQSEHPLFALDYVITASCGEGFIRKLASQGVTVKLTEETDPLTAVKSLLATL